MRGLAAVVIAALLGCAETAPPPVAPASPPPLAAPAPAVDTHPVTDGEVTTATVDGIQIVVQRMPGAAFAAGHLYVRGGTRNWTAENAGIEHFAFRVAASGGTRALEKTAFSRRLASLGATLEGDARNDFSSVRVKAPLEAWDDAFALLVDVLVRPALPSAEVELVRTQLLAELHHEQEDPDGQLWTLARKQIFTGHPYANRAVGTVESVSRVKQEDLAPYLENLRETSRLVFVAAGDLEPSRVIAQVHRALGGMRRGRYVDSPLPPVAFGASHLVTQERKIPTNYCESVFNAPRWSDPDRVAGLVAVASLSRRLWDELRTKRGLTYQVNASINEGFAHPIGTLYVTTVDPNATMRVMLDEIKRLRDEPMPDKELAGFKSVYRTSYLEEHETPDGIASALGEAQLLGGDWRIGRDFPERLRAVTAADVQAFAKRYLVHMQAVVVGDPAKIDAALFTSL